MVRSKSILSYLPFVFYYLLKLYARLSIKIYCRRIIINKPGFIHAKGPLLLAANHPNSFFDGIILTTLFEEPVHSLARGDAFKNKSIARLLRSIQLLPVYRSSEGAENLEHNYATFAACQQTFESGGIVLIFSEGRCENEWHLRPLKKGTARLALAAWNKGIPLTVVPTAFNYSSFRSYGKEVHLYFGEPLDRERILREETEGKQMLRFNEDLHKQLQELVYEIPPTDRATIRRIFSIRIDYRFFLLALPGLAGILIHAPLFLVCKIISHRFYHSGHYDSVLHGLLLVTYPFYFLVVLLISFHYGAVYALLGFFLLPFTAWAATEIKYQSGF